MPAKLLQLSVALCLVGVCVQAQLPAVRPQIEPLIQGLQSTDDLVALPDGSFAVSRPVQPRTVDRVNIATGQITTLDAGPVVALGMTLSLDGTYLYYGDDITDSIYRINLLIPGANREVVINGMTTPVDLLFHSSGTLWVMNHESGTFPFGPCTLYRIDFVAGVAQPPLVTLIAIPGVADMEWTTAEDALVITSFAAIDLIVYSLVGGQVTLLTYPELATAADLIRLPDGNFLITTTSAARILHLNSATLVLTVLVSGFTSTGSGAEDMAFDSSGDLLLTVNIGEIWRLNLTTDLRQIGDAPPGSVLQIIMNAPSRGGESYALACSFTAQNGVPFGPWLAALDNDFLFSLSLTRPVQLIGFDGVLDPSGNATALMLVPSVPSLTGFQFVVAGVYFTFSPLFQPTGVTNGLLVEID